MLSMKTVGWATLVVGAVIAGGCGPTAARGDKVRDSLGKMKFAILAETEEECAAGANPNYAAPGTALYCCYLPDEQLWGNTRPDICGAPDKLTAAQCESNSRNDCNSDGACLPTDYRSGDVMDVTTCVLVDKN